MAENPIHAFVYNRLRKEEKFSPTIYPDSRGNPTVGLGFNLNDPTISYLIPPDVRSGKRLITEAESDLIARQRIALAEKDARQFVGDRVFDSLDPLRKSSLLDMSYNMGLPALSGFEKTKEALQSGNFNKAANEILDSDYARRDAPNRAKRNASLMRTGWWDVSEPYMRYETLRKSRRAVSK